MNLRQVSLGLVALIFAPGTACSFEPAAATELATGLPCSVDRQCASSLCSATAGPGVCVECRGAEGCAGGLVCEANRCVAQPLARTAQADFGGPVQVDARGRQHRGRIQVPALSTPRLAGGAQ